jgi:hypothetical protein
VIGGHLVDKGIEGPSTAQVEVALGLVTSQILGGVAVEVGVVWVGGGGACEFVYHEDIFIEERGNIIIWRCYINDDNNMVCIYTVI